MNETTRASRPDAARTPRGRGFTVLELMVTMAIASALLALGAGMFLRLGRRTAMTQAIADVHLLVTKAKNASTRVPAELIADPKAGAVFARVEEVLQELHFEPRPTDAGPVVPLGIEGRDCTIAGGTTEPDGGRVGGGVRLSGGSVSCGNFAAYDVDQGLSAEVWIRPAGVARCDLASRGESFKFHVQPSGSGSMIVAKVRVRDAEKSAEESVTVSANVPLVRAGEWTGFSASYDGREVVLTTDEGYGPVVRARVAENRPLAIDSVAPLLFGAGLDGWIDDCRFGGIRSADPVRLPDGLSIHEPKRVRFVNGRLDPTVHSGSETLTLRYGPTLTTFEIGPAGTVLRVEESAAPEAPPTDGAKKPGSVNPGSGGPK